MALGLPKANKQSSEVMEDLQEKVRQAELHKDTVVAAVDDFSKKKWIK